MAAICGSVGAALCAQHGMAANVSALNSAALIIFILRLLNKDGEAGSARTSSAADSLVNMVLDVTCASPVPGCGLQGHGSLDRLRIAITRGSGNTQAPLRQRSRATKRAMWLRGVATVSCGERVL
jgi:hypothetical protein